VLADPMFRVGVHDVRPRGHNRDLLLSGPHDLGQEGHGRSKTVGRRARNARLPARYLVRYGSDIHSALHASPIERS
jgi:hypothetical protein